VTFRFAVVDDHELLAQSLCLALQARGFAATTHAVLNLSSTLCSVINSAPDVVLLDLQLGKAGHGLSLIRPLCDAGISVLVVSGVTDEVEIATTLESGAAGFISKSEHIDVLMQTAVAVARDEQVTSTHRRQQLLATLRRHRARSQRDRAPFEKLTCAEREVLRSLCGGQSVTQIAHQNVLSVATVRAHVRAIHTKLGVSSQLEAVALAYGRHWYEDPLVMTSR
jgi:DNA-binding NarL/FixJ family response regulator